MKEKKEVRMIAAVSAAIDFKKNNPSSDNEKILQHIIKIASRENEEESKLGMIAAAAKALSIIERNPNMHERAVIKQVISEFPSIIAGMDKE